MMSATLIYSPPPHVNEIPPQKNRSNRCALYYSLWPVNLVTIKEYETARQLYYAHLSQSVLLRKKECDMVEIFWYQVFVH